MKTCLISDEKKSEVQEISKDDLSGERISSLKYLDANFSKISIKPKLLVRILSISKVKNIFHATIQSILNILVCDNTCYTKIVCFGETARDLYQSQIKEGDILFLSNYSISMYDKSRTSYILQPKSLKNFRIGLSPTEIELKITNINNVSKLCDFIHEHVPHPIWHLFKHTFLLEKFILPDRLVDVFGSLTIMGRVEREQVFEKGGKSTGQFWCRIWVGIRDNTEAKNPLLIKLYLNKKQIDELSLICPGDVILITHLLTKIQNNRLQFLESTNETCIFSQKELKSEKFFELSTSIESLKNNILLKDLTKWLECFKHARLGGAVSPVVHSPKNSINNYLTHRGQVMRQIATLTYKTISRFVVQCQIISVKNCMTNETEEDCIGGPKPSLLNISGLSRPDLVSLVRHNVQFQISPDIAFKYKNEETCIVELKLVDCAIKAQFNKSIKDIEEMPFFKPLYIELEIYKYCINKNSVVITMLGIHNRQPIVDPAEDCDSDNDMTTQELAKLFK